MVGADFSINRSLSLDFLAKPAHTVKKLPSWNSLILL